MGTSFIGLFLVVGGVIAIGIAAFIIVLFVRRGSEPKE